MKAEPEEYHRLRDALFLRAALEEEFNPRALLREVIPDAQQKDILLRGKLMSALREASTGGQGRWQMRPVQRRKILANTVAGADVPETGTDISAALHGSGAFSAEGLTEVTQQSAAPADLARVVATLEQAGPAAPGHKRLLELSSRLDHLRREQATDTLLGGSFVGREDEVATLLHTLDNPQRAAPLRTLHIQGLPGVGKTFLLEHLGRLCRDRPRIVMIRLDFDRSSLRDGAADAVFEEISRQIGTAMPPVAGLLHDLRMERAERRTKIASGSDARVPFDLLHRMISILADHDRQVLFLFDTLEVLHGYGATFVHQLFADIDRFADKERIDISLISAGRGPVFARDDARLQGFIALEELDDKVTAAILEKRDVPAHLRDRIVALSGGNPLRLILVARAVQESETGDALEDAQIRSAGTGYLYRTILSRVPADVREIAAEGLILPELTAESLTQIVAPALDLSIDKDRAGQLLDTLEMQRWLVTRTRGGEGLAHLPEVRREILGLTYAESPARAARINRGAAAFYASTHPGRALYHRLQLVRAGDPMPDIEPEPARQLPDDLLDDLTDAARDEVLRARGQRSRVEAATPPDAQPIAAPPGAPGPVDRVPQSGIRALRDVWLQSDPQTPDGRLMVVVQGAPGATPDSGSLADLRNMLELRERQEATFILKNNFGTPFALDSEAGLLALAHQWQTGHWSLARVLFAKLPEETVLRAVREDISLTGLALLEIWAEFRFDALCARLAQDEKLLEAAAHALSLTQRSGLRDGALAMAWLTVAGSEARTEISIADMMARYLPHRTAFSSRDMLERCDAVRAELGVVFAPDETDPQEMALADYARLTAPLNPYAVPVRALLDELSLGGETGVTRQITALAPALTELADTFAPGVEGAEEAQDRTGARPGETAELMNVLGLTAEFATGYTFYTPLADLPTVARAAERWQLATLGLWSYGRQRPLGWDQSAQDLLIRERVAALFEAGDAPEAALRMLRIWDDPEEEDDAANPPPVLHRRLARLYADLTGADTLETRLQMLTRSNLPAVMQAPVAVLADLGVPAQKIFGT